MPRKKLEDLEPVAKETPKPRKRIAPTPVETITYQEDDYEAEIVTSKESTTRRVN